jgi:Zn finger protein HypA/HybF involved in hydrogenase expression
MSQEIKREYIMRYGGGSTAEDIWYDEEVIIVKEGDVCPECGKGKMKVSKNKKLYCSEICWEVK